MARMHSGARGKSGSKKPLQKKKPTWTRYDAKTVEQLVLKVAKLGHKPSLIGTILRDSYGIPDVEVITGKKITKILEQNKQPLKIPEDISYLIKKDIALMKHFEKNKHDFAAKRGMILTESKIKRLANYYTRTDKLPKDWRFDRTKAKMFIE